MKKTLIAIASIAAMGAAVAGNTVYGVVDINVSSTSGGGAASQTAITDNGYSSSRFGVKGDIDLGDGLKGIYQYESNVTIAKPGPISWGDRGAFAGITGAFGTVTLGRSFTPYAISLFNDAMEYDNLSAYWNANYPYIGVHADKVWQSNAISYTTPSLNGLTINAMVSPGGDATNAASTSYELNKKTGEIDATSDGIHGASVYTGLGATYGLGALNLTAGWESNKVGSTSVTTTASNVGFAYGFGVATVSAAFQKADNGSKQDSGWNVGAAIPVGGKYAVQAGYASMNTNLKSDTTQTATSIVLVNDITAAARLYAGVVNMTATGALNSSAVKAGVKYSF